MVAISKFVADFNEHVENKYFVAISDSEHSSLISPLHRIYVAKQLYNLTHGGSFVNLRTKDDKIISVATTELVVYSREDYFVCVGACLDKLNFNHKLKNIHNEDNYFQRRDLIGAFETHFEHLLDLKKRDISIFDDEEYAQFNKRVSYIYGKDKK